MHQTTYVPKETNHLLHLVLTAATCGLWAPVWFLVVIINTVTKDKHTTVTTGGWYQQPVARPYEVGPGAPVGPMNPATPTPPVAMPPMPPYVGYGRSRAPQGMARPPELHGMYCQHGQHRSLYCEPCGNEAMDEAWDQPATCGFTGCFFKTPFGPVMVKHYQDNHNALPPPPQ